MTLEERNKLKTKIQDEIAELSVIHPFMLLEISTGFGKALAVIKSIAKCPSNNKKWLILVPEIQQITNFEKEFIKFGYENLLNDKVEAIICYDSLHKYEGKSLNIVANECQHLNSNNVRQILNISYDRIICDSATVSYSTNMLISNLGEFYTYTIDLKNGIELGIMFAPKIYIIDVNIEDSSKVFEYTKFKKKQKGKALQYYTHLTEQIKYWKQRYESNQADFEKNKFLQFASMRKKLMADIKTEKAKELINQFKNERKRFISYSGSVAQAIELLGEECTVYSKKSPKKNLQIIENFNSLEISEISSCGMLVEGMNLEALDTVLVVQLDSGYETEGGKIKQQLGRVRNRPPELYILRLKDSKDDTYLNNAINAIGKEFVVKN